MARFTHKVSGVRVSVADDAVLGPEWEPEGEKPAQRTTKKPSAKKKPDTTSGD